MATAAENWVQQAEYDLETARGLLEIKRYLYVLFCCQQALEKMLKALIAKQTKELPPRSHNLTRLAELAISKVPEERADLLRYLSRYYIQSRYPEEIADVAKEINKEKAQEVFNKTQEMFQWLSSML
ncbi:MAG: HEPN domain-containing protein [Deltaproteobacteria bacterium]|nr:HEPN domain-containing protein [Deltaproteobacteria bacterium]